MDLLHWRSFAAFMIISITSMLPYNMFMNATQYFFYKLRNVTDSDLSSGLTASEIDRTSYNVGQTHLTDLQRTFEGWFTITSWGGCVIGAILNAGTTKHVSNGFRVLSGHIVAIAIMTVTLWGTWIDTDHEQALFFWVSLVLASIAALGSNGFIYGGIMGLASRFGERYVQSVTIGQAAAGIVSTTLSIVCQTVTGDGVINGRIYFCLALGWTATSIGVYFWLTSSKYAEEVLNRPDHLPIISDSYSGEEIDGVESDENGLETSMDLHEQHHSVMRLYGDVLKQAFLPFTLMAIIFTVTLSVYPAVASLVDTQSTDRTIQAYFTAICCFLLYNCFDAIGRVSAMFTIVSLPTLTKLVLARFVLVPLIFFCNVEPRYYTPTLIHADPIFVILMIVMAFSQGFCLAHATVAAAEAVDPHLKEPAGSMNGVVSNVTCIAGAVLGIALVTFA